MGTDGADKSVLLFDSVVAVVPFPCFSFPPVSLWIALISIESRRLSSLWPTCCCCASSSIVIVSAANCSKVQGVEIEGCRLDERVAEGATKAVELGHMTNTKVVYNYNGRHHGLRSCCGVSGLILVDTDDQRFVHDFRVSMFLFFSGIHTTMVA
jgi:hypothetical protein